MASAPEILEQRPAQIRRYLMAVQIAALTSIALRAAPLVSLLLSRRPNLRAHVPTVLSSLLIVVPYVVVLFRLWMSTEKKGLALAVGWGTTNFVLLSGALFTRLSLGKSPAWALLVWLVQAVLVVTALKGYFGMRREPEDRKRLILGFVKAVCYFTLINFIVVLSA